MLNFRILVYGISCVPLLSDYVLSLAKSIGMFLVASSGVAGVEPRDDHSLEVLVERI